MKEWKTRSLTEGELDYLKPYFKDSLDYDKIKVHNKRYFIFHNKNGGLVLGNNIYLDGKGAIDDFSKSDVTPFKRGFLLHEVTHVWQKQNKVMNLPFEFVNEMLSNKFNYLAAYKCKLEADKDFVDYGLEQQPTILQHYHVLKELMASEPDKTSDLHKKREGAIEKYEAVLQNFLDDPNYAKKCQRSFTGKAYLKRRP